MRSRSRRCFLRRGTVCGERELVWCIPSFDGVHCLEHCDMKHRQRATVRRGQNFVFRGNRIGFGIPVHDDIGSRRSGEHCGQCGRQQYS